MYIFIGFFMALNSNLQVPIPENSSFARFGVDTVSTLAKKLPKAPKLFNMILFILQLVIYRLDFSKIFQNVDAIVINMKLVLLTMTNLVHVPWGLFRT